MTERRKTGASPTDADLQARLSAAEYVGMPTTYRPDWVHGKKNKAHGPQPGPDGVYEFVLECDPAAVILADTPPLIEDMLANALRTATDQMKADRDKS